MALFLWSSRAACPSMANKAMRCISSNWNPPPGNLSRSKSMSQIFSGRYTAKSDEPFVVFLIGMRINKWWRFDKWLPVSNAMGPMLQALFTDPEKGFLHAEFFWNFHGPVLIQYWQSFEDLERFARHPSGPHLAAWKKFNQSIGADGNVGIWHETYTVNPDQFKSVYGN